MITLLNVDRVLATIVMTIIATCKSLYFSLCKVLQVGHTIDLVAHVVGRYGSSIDTKPVSVDTNFSDTITSIKVSN